MITQSRQTRKDVTIDIHITPFNLIQIVKKGKREERPLIFYFFTFLTWMTRVDPENSESPLNGWLPCNAVRVGYQATSTVRLYSVIFEVLNHGMKSDLLD